MRNKIILMGLIASLTAGPAFADKASREESAGVGVGATIGAIAGGPLGLIVGAAIGAKVGDGYHERNEQVDTLSASLESSEDRARRLEKNIQSLNGKIAGLDSEVEQLRESSSPELVSLLQAGIAMDLLFRTDEDTLADSTGTRLQAMATTLATMTDIQVQLDGFADERGDADYNQELSVRRAEHVRDVLLANGIPASRIQINAHGEAMPIDSSVDSYALDRKVSLTLYVPNSASFAANPN